jgi:hypothetical protein
VTGRCSDAEGDKLMRSLLFWDVTQPRLVVSYRRFGTPSRSHILGSSSPRGMDSLTVKDGTDRLSRKVGNYQFTLRIIPGGCKSHIQDVPKPMSQTSPGYSPPLIKQKLSYQHGSKSEQYPRYPLTFMCGYPLRY